MQARQGTRQAAQGQARRVEGKLGNANFLAKAPQAVVAKERERGKALAHRRDVLEGQMARLSAL